MLTVVVATVVDASEDATTAAGAEATVVAVTVVVAATVVASAVVAGAAVVAVCALMHGKRVRPATNRTAQSRTSV